MFIALLIAASILPTPPDVLRDACDLVEINALYDGYGKIVFYQIIFYDWSDDDARFQVRDYRLAHGPGYEHSPTARKIDVERDFARGGYACVWVDGEVTRSVRAAEFRETWTQFDPELNERQILPKERRRGLRGAR